MSRAASIAKAAWLLLAAAALAFHVYAVLFTAAADSHIVFGWAMMVLTFPLGLLPLFGYGLLSQMTGGEASQAGGLLGVLCLWLIMTTVGFFQWFWLLPKALDWARRSGASAFRRR